MAGSSDSAINQRRVIDCADVFAFRRAYNAACYASEAPLLSGRGDDAWASCSPNAFRSARRTTKVQSRCDQWLILHRRIFGHSIPVGSNIDPRIRGAQL